jgi:putative addiction module component (TIGR02574 family)
MATLTKSEIAALSVDERLALIEDLWSSLENYPELLPTPDWHWPLVEARLKAQQANPQPTHSWESIRAEMEDKWLA